MIELRPKVSGTYKGLIYCSSMEEANEILKEISPIINRLIICKIKIKRGCSEYVDIFSNYKVTNKENINLHNRMQHPLSLHTNATKTHSC